MKARKKPRDLSVAEFKVGSGGSPRPLPRSLTIWRSACGGWLSVPRRCSPRQAELSVSQQDRSDCHQAELSGEASLPGSESTRRWVRAGHGSGTSANRSHHFRLVPRTAPACDGALARDDGSSLLSLKLHFICSRATTFSIPPVFRRLTKLCQACFPPRRPRLLSLPPCDRGIFQRGCPAKARPPCWFAVATPTLTGSGHCVSSAGRNFPRILTRPAAVSDCHPPRNFLFACRAGATRCGGIRELCPAIGIVSGVSRREPGAPTAPGHSPV